MSQAPTSDTRTIHFRDARPPHEIRHELEREHMVLLQPHMRDGRLELRAELGVNGARCRLLLRFEDVLAGENCYSLRIELSWTDQPAEAQDYHRRAAPGWLDYWSGRYAPSEPLSTHRAPSEAYAEVLKRSLAAEAVAPDIATVQQHILEQMRAGATYSTSHKEGGTRLMHDGRSFVRSDYGDNEAMHRYASDGAFLKALRQFWDWQISRGVHPAKVDEYTAWILILRLLQPPPKHEPAPTNSPQSHPSPQARAPQAGKRGRIAGALIGAAILGVLALGDIPNPMTVQTIGSPSGPAAGSPEHVAMLIQKQVPYLPSMHRDASKDRYTFSLLVHARDGSGRTDHVALDGKFDASRSGNVARMLGFDGKLFWFIVDDIHGYDPRSKRLVTLADLRRMNPGLDELWPVGHYEFHDRLLVSTRDNRVFVEIDPQTLIARRLERPPTGRRMLPPDPAKSMLAPAPARADGTIDVAYVRERYDAPPLTLANPASKLATYWRRLPDLQRELLVSRVDASDKTQWETPTGITRLHQVLPDARHLALIGERSRGKDKVAEPVLALLHNDTGTIAVQSLWIDR